MKPLRVLVLSGRPSGLAWLGWGPALEVVLLGAARVGGEAACGSACGSALPHGL